MFSKLTFGAIVASVALISTGPVSADTLSMTATYFTVTTPDPDFQSVPSQCCATFNNEVMATLANGLPVYNAGYGGPALQDVSGGNLTWWSPTLNSNVQQTSTSTITLPYLNNAFFAPNGTGPDNTHGIFQTAIFSGVLVVPTAETVTFTFGADDDAILALNNDVIAQLGGVHQLTAGPVTTTTLAAGSYNLELFYADRQTTDAKLQFSIDTEGVSISPGVPEPSTWAMLLLGFAGIGFMAYHGQSKTAFRLV
jgi:fibro-slime domain-containing protein